MKGRMWRGGSGEVASKIAQIIINKPKTNTEKRDTAFLKNYTLIADMSPEPVG